MNKRIFLDVGAHTGEMLAAVLDPGFRFDEIFCFEPSRLCREKLRSAAGHDVRVRILKFGLWNSTALAPLFDPGSQGGSLFRYIAKKANDNERQLG